MKMQTDRQDRAAVGRASPNASTSVARGFGCGLACLLALLVACEGTSPAGRTTGTGAGGAAAAGAGGTPTGPGTAGGGGQRTPSPSTVSLDGSPIYTRMQRLTNAQWERAVADVLRFASPANLSQGFSTPAVAESTEFSNNEKRLFVDQQAELQLEAAAESAATLATGSATALARLYPAADAEGLVRSVGRRAFRRPLTPEEETKYQGIFALGEKLYGAGFANGAALVIRAMLQSPKFLYRSELGPDGMPLDGYEVASKLSFWLLGTTPSDDVLDAAGAGQLDSVDGLASAARAMLAEPAAVEIMRDFHRQLYELDRYQDIDTVGTSYRFFDAIFTRGEGLRAILTSTLLDPARPGFFMQLPFLALNRRGDTPDTIGRGVALNRQVLCFDIAGHTAPVPALAPPAPGQTNRDRIEAATAGCDGCHADYIDPLGFAFESFDGAGQPRTFDNGAPVDTTGSYPFADGSRRFSGAGELLRLMADGAQAHTCYAKKLAGYALQRDIVDSDRPLLQELAEASRERSSKELIVSLVRNPAFRSRAGGMP